MHMFEALILLSLMHKLLSLIATDGCLENKQLLGVNKNESDIWLEFIEWIFIRESCEINIVVEEIKFPHEEGKWVLHAFTH